MLSEEDIKVLEEYKEKMIKDERIHDDYRNMLTAIENLINRNKQLEADNYEQNNIINNYIEIEKEHKKENGRLRDRINKTINKLNEDISDDNCMWVNNQEKIVKTAKTIIDRSNYAKKILELLEERN